MLTFWASLVYMSVLMFMREVLDILLSLVSLESNENFGIKIYLKPLKMSLPLNFFGPTSEESWDVKQILR